MNDDKIHLVVMLVGDDPIRCYPWPTKAEAEAFAEGMGEAAAYNDDPISAMVWPPQAAGTSYDDATVSFARGLIWEWMEAHPGNPVAGMTKQGA